jgi:exonuclease III
MIKKINFLLALLILAGTFFFCNRPKIDKFTIAFYNVENLFDTINDDGVRDGDFTPEAKLNWNSEKYTAKLEGIAKVLTTIGQEDFPAIVGLAEIENGGVLKDLINKTNLAAGKYQFIHYQSPDERGIDVALLYRKDYFTPIYSKAYGLHFPFDEDDRTRDMLYVKGVTALKDTFHIMVDHWPSRSGGQEESDPKRRFAASLVRSVVDSIFKTDKQANIIIMGDLNDNPTDVSVAEILNAKKPGNIVKYDDLYNLALTKFELGEGTLYWRSWDLFDQIIVSGNILDDNTKLKLDPKDILILKEDWMLFKRDDGVKVPSRTAGRDAYYGGYSDHLPVYITLKAE